MDKKRVLQIVLLVLTIGWMIFIFGMSGEESTESAARSEGLTAFVQKTFFPEWESLPEEAFLIHMSELHFLIRKIAHFVEFLILGGLLAGLFLTFPFPRWLSSLIAFGAGGLYAFTDELHQLFSAGRSMSFFDMLIDGAGVFLGITVVLAGILIVSGMIKEKGPAAGKAASSNTNHAKE